MVILSYILIITLIINNFQFLRNFLFSLKTISRLYVVKIKCVLVFSRCLVICAKDKPPGGIDALSFPL